MFSSGRLIFVLFFITIFIIGMIYAYRQDLKTIRQQYSGIYLVFITLTVFLLILYLLVKFHNRI
ncbi:MAG: hypothetical protein KatS3mg028_0648 [Bacteroidia bacterium]|nr:MAG: hypothetical protein KatS3mg028_0648 [Bacteroidia bacterium]